MYRCLNPECKKSFPVYARISTEKHPQNFDFERKRVIVDRACCPYCEGIDLEVIQ